MSVLLASAMPATALAIDSFIQEKESGWFWYETEPEEPEEEKPKVLPPPPPPPPQVIKLAPPPEPEKKEEKPKPPEGLSVEWFKQTYPQILNNAVDNPTPENVSQYRYATRVMLDKASNFAHEFKRQALMDPLLDENNRYPFSSAARGSFQRFTTKQKMAAVENIAKQAGLWVFIDQSCPFCALQYPVIARTAKERGFLVRYITPDGVRPEWMGKEEDVVKDEGQGKALKIGVRPATALVVPPAQISVLTQGMLSQDLLEERILFAGDMVGLIDGKLRKDAFPNERGLLTTEDIHEAGKVMQGDTKALTPKIQELLEKRY